MAAQIHKTWEVEERRLVDAGFTPCWDAEQERIAARRNCRNCAGRLIYVGMTDGYCQLAVGVCPICGLGHARLV